MFAPLAKEVLRIEDAARIPEYVARAWTSPSPAGPGPVVVVLPEDMLTDEVEAIDRPSSPASPRPPIRSPSRP